MEEAREITEILLDIGAVKVRMNPPFMWTSGIAAPVYCDNRILISHPDPRKRVIEGFIDIIRGQKLDPQCIGGTATAGIPWAAFLAYELDLPMIYIRPEKKAHGAGKQVEGELEAGTRVLMVEDLISTGGSSVSAAQAVQAERKGVVTDVLAIVTWELEEARKRFLESGIRLSALTNFSNIVGAALERKIIGQEEWQRISEFKKNPRAWGKHA